MNQDDQLSMPPVQDSYDIEPDTVATSSTGSSSKIGTLLVGLHATLLFGLLLVGPFSWVFLLVISEFVQGLLGEVVDGTAILNITFIISQLLFLIYFAAICTVDFLFLKHSKPSSAVRILVIISMTAAVFMCLMLASAILFSRFPAGM